MVNKSKKSQSKVADIHTMANGKETEYKKYKPKHDVPVAETFEEFCDWLIDYLAANDAHFAIYIDGIGALPEDEQKKFSLFTEDPDASGSKGDGSEQFCRLAAMFYSLCENKHLNVKEELTAFTAAVARAAIKMGDKSFDD